MKTAPQDGCPFLALRDYRDDTFDYVVVCWAGGDYPWQIGDDADDAVTEARLWG